jgi:hypothetical protein
MEANIDEEIDMRQRKASGVVAKRDIRCVLIAKGPCTVSSKLPEI